MDPMTIAKGVTDILVATGAGAVVGNLVKATTPANLKLVQKISLGVGGFVLSSMAGSYASKYAVEQIDVTVEQIKGITSAFKKD